MPFYASPVGPAQPQPLATQFATVVVKPHAGQRADLLANALRREVAKADPNLPLYAVVFATVAGVSLAATMVPARRATRVDPMIALTAE